MRASCFHEGRARANLVDPWTGFVAFAWCGFRRWVFRRAGGGRARVRRSRLLRHRRGFRLSPAPAMRERCVCQSRSPMRRALQRTPLSETGLFDIDRSPQQHECARFRHNRANVIAFTRDHDGTARAPRADRSCIGAGWLAADGGSSFLYARVGPCFFPLTFISPHRGGVRPSHEVSNIIEWHFIPPGFEP